MGGGGFLPLIETKDCKKGGKSLKSEGGTLWNVGSEKGLANSHTSRTVRMAIVYKYRIGGEFMRRM